MFAKTLIAALILATTSVAQAGPFGHNETSYFDRASQVIDGGN